MTRHNFFFCLLIKMKWTRRRSTGRNIYKFSLWTNRGVREKRRDIPLFYKWQCWWLDGIRLAFCSFRFFSLLHALLFACSFILNGNERRDLCVRWHVLFIELELEVLVINAFPWINVEVDQVYAMLERWYMILCHFLMCFRRDRRD